MTNASLQASFVLDEPVLSADETLVRLADPFTTAPSQRMLRAKAECIARGLVPERFAGRAGIAIIAQDGELQVLLALEPSPKHYYWQKSRLSADRLWPGMRADELPAVALTDAAGNTKTLAERLDEIFEPFPARDYHRGGKEQEVRRGLWRRALTDALTSPSVVLAERINTLHKEAKLLELAEWWCGRSPTFEPRFDGTFYAPRSGARFWLEWMLAGRGFEGSTPLQNPDSLPAPDILYEDDALVVINKPTRLSSVPGVRETASAKMALDRIYGEVFVVHRLDLDTSGILVFAKHKQALVHLNESFRERVTQKHYVARLEGDWPEEMPETGTIDMALALNWLDRPRQCVLLEDFGGKRSVTDYALMERVQTRSGTKALVRLMPETGRTHQLRLHCAMGLKRPIDGDPFYGRLGLMGETKATRLCLHAAFLSFPHPTSNRTVAFECPPDFGDF